MMKRLLVSAIFLMLLFTASAQQFGVYGNVMLSKKLGKFKLISEEE
jgi:Skp family chaperone for outer membrane proteins